MVSSDFFLFNNNNHLKTIITSSNYSNTNTALNAGAVEYTDFISAKE